MNGKRIICSCSCGDPEHLLVFDYYHDVDKNPFPDEISVTFTSTFYESFWNRVSLGLKYIFKGRSFSTSDSIIFEYSNIIELENACKFLRAHYIKRGYNEK